MSEQQDSTSESSRGTSLRLDQANINPSWLPPEDGDPADDRPGLPMPVKFAIVVLALVVVIGGVWALGGFKTRTDLRTEVTPGQLIVTGPYEFTFTDATAQKVKDYSDKITWQVIIKGSGRTTGNESISPSTLGSMFLAKDPNTVETPDADTDSIGGGAGYDGANTFTPGLAPVPYQIQFTFSEHYKPSDIIQFGVFEIEYGNALLLDTGEKGWKNSDYIYVYRLPVKVLPPDLDD